MWGTEGIDIETWVTVDRGYRIPMKYDEICACHLMSPALPVFASNNQEY